MAYEIQGMKQLHDQLTEIGGATAKKALTQSLSASAKQLVRELKAAAPVGSRAHFTYMGRLVAPGFLSRSVTKQSGFDKKSGTAFVKVGVKAEAFYGVSFIESGLETRNLSPQPWFIKTFRRNRYEISDSLAKELKKRIDRAAEAHRK